MPQTKMMPHKPVTKQQLKNMTKFEHNHIVIYIGTCPERSCNDNYIGEAK